MSLLSQELRRLAGPPASGPVILKTLLTGCKISSKQPVNSHGVGVNRIYPLGLKGVIRDENENSGEGIHQSVKPFPAAKMQCWPVDRIVNKVGDDDTSNCTKKVKL